MATITAHDIVELTRTNLDLIPQSGEVVDTMQDVMEARSRTVATEVLLRWVLHIENDLAAACAALYLQNLLTTYEGDLAAFDQSLMERPLWARREEGGTWYDCLARTKEEHRTLEATPGRRATPRKPVIIWDDNEVEIYPTGGTVRLTYVRRPTRISLSDYNAGDDDLGVSPVLRWALLFRVTAEACRELSDPREGFYAQLADLFTAPFLRSFRIGVPRDYAGGPRVNEQEVRTE